MLKYYLAAFLSFLAIQASPQKPSPSHLTWVDAEIGVIIHFDVVNFVPEYNWRSWGSHPPASVFNPSRLDTDQWLRAAKAAGAKYAVLVAKHCSGFSLWPTEAHAYSVKNAPWKNGKGDVVAAFVKSCRKYGIRPGIYCSVSANGYLHVDNPGRVVSGDTTEQKRYNEIAIQQLTELWSNYGEQFEIWFDGGVLPVSQGGPDIAPVLKQLQPNAVVFQGPADAKNLIRWIGNEEGLAPYPNWSRANNSTAANGTIEIKDLQGDPEGKIWCPGEADFPLRTGWQGGWFWKAEGQSLLSLDQLTENYYTSVGRNANMLLGIVVDTSGLVPEEDFRRLEAFGREIRRRFSKPLAEISGNGKTLELSIGNAPQVINHVILMENIAEGERIRKYVLEARINDQWAQIAEGISVGHKRIHQFAAISTDRIRLRVIESAKKPQILSLSVYNVK